MSDRVYEPPLNGRPQAPGFPIYTTRSVSTPSAYPNPSNTPVQYTPSTQPGP